MAHMNGDGKVGLYCWLDDVDKWLAREISAILLGGVCIDWIRKIKL